MTLDEMEKLATIVVAEDVELGSVRDALARSLLLLLPIARDAIALYERAEKCHDRPYMGCPMSHSDVESALYDSIDALRTHLVKAGRS